MNLRRIDLNLLVILDTLLDEAHVTRAAQRLALSQPAMSNALARCRELFNDPLLIKAGAGMKLTAKAQSLRLPLKRALNNLDAVFEPEQPTLATLRAKIRIGMADALLVTVAAPLQQQLQQSAPGISLIYLPWRGGNEIQQQLTNDEMDIAISVLPTPSPGLRRQELAIEHYQVIMRQGHPAAGNFTLDTWLAYPHVVVSPSGDARGSLDDVLLRLGCQRQIGLVLPSFSAALHIVAHTDLIAMVPSRSLTNDDTARLTIFDPPVPIETFPLHIAWHERNDNNHAVQYVGALLRRVIS
ncbi:MAG: LysR family transcriptional regulator [Betaproteobacteria bacterium]|nr:LysR family transcriptional regulator [Betaproteobacteria bacterium]